ncbi:MAG TPA: SCO family protein [Blastocatellia bacterium]|nr:SCO family protein [Blastocatellia bacterium]
MKFLSNLVVPLCLLVFLSSSALGQHEDHLHHHPPAKNVTVDPDTTKVSLPDINVLDQEGRKRNFARDLIKGKTVAINFVFTTCTTICPPLGATFAKVQTLLGARQDIHLISISIDPVTDTPERLKAWRAKFSTQPGWTLVTGNKADIDQLLKALGGFSARKEDHTPTVLIGNEATNQWTRAYGLAQPAQLVTMLEEKAKAAPSPAQKYFTDVELINQRGEKLRFYSDLIKDHTVIINAFFTTCTSVCPPMNKNFARLQDALGDRLGKDVFILSLSVDPTTDTPERLQEYAARFSAKPGWHFLTGKKENIEQALRKLGQYVTDKNDHLTVVLIGNDKTGLWKKAHGLAKAEALLAVVESVVNDKGPTQAEGGK